MEDWREWMERALKAEKTLLVLWAEYECQKEQFGDSPIWQKYEDEDQIRRVEEHVEWVQEDWDEN